MTIYSYTTSSILCLNEPTKKLSLRLNKHGHVHEFLKSTYETRRSENFKDLICNKNLRNGDQHLVLMEAGFVSMLQYNNILSDQ